MSIESFNANQRALHEYPHGINVDIDVYLVNERQQEHYGYDNSHYNHTNDMGFVETDYEAQEMDIDNLEFALQGEPFPPMIDSRYEVIKTAIASTAEHYHGVNVSRVYDDISRFAIEKYHSEDYGHKSPPPLLISDLDEVFKTGRGLQGAVRHGTNEPAGETFYTNFIRQIESPAVLELSGDNLHESINKMDSRELMAVAELSLREYQDAEAYIENARHSAYSRLDSSIKRKDISANSVPPVTKYLKNIAIDNDPQDLSGYMSSIKPALKGMAGLSGTGFNKLKKEHEARMEQSPDDKLKNIAKFQKDRAELAKYMTCQWRDKPRVSQKPLDFHGLDFKEAAENGTLKDMFTKTYANISLVRFCDSEGGSKPRSFDSTILNNDDVLQSAGSLVLKTGIDGYSNPTYSGVANHYKDAFAVLKVNEGQSISGAKNIAIGSSPDIADTVGFAYMTEDNGATAYDAVLYAQPESLSHVIDSINKYNPNTPRIDVVGDMMPHKSLKVEMHDDVMFEAGAPTGLDFARITERQAVANGQNVKVLLPVGGKESWSEIRKVTTDLALDNGLGYEDAKNYFKQLVNHSIVESVERSDKLKQELERPAKPEVTHDNEQRLAIAQKQAHEQELQNIEEPAIRQPTRRMTFGSR